VRSGEPPAQRSGGADREPGEAGLEALRRQASKGSPALEAEEPVLDYLLGGEER